MIKWLLNLLSNKKQEKTDYNLDVPSERILFALEALKEFEAKPGCVVDMYMSSYHKYKDNTCFACLGGAAALKYYKIIEDDYKDIDDMGDIAAKAGVSYGEVVYFESSLDCVRVGYINSMFYYMDLPKEEGEKYNRDITDYHKDREAFYADMYQLAEDLKAGGY